MVELIALSVLWLCVGLSIGVVIGIRRGQSVNVCQHGEPAAPVELFTTTVKYDPHQHQFAKTPFSEDAYTVSRQCTRSGCSRVYTTHK